MLLQVQVVRQWSPVALSTLFPTLQRVWHEAVHIYCLGLFEFAEFDCPVPMTTDASHRQKEAFMKLSLG